MPEQAGWCRCSQCWMASLPARCGLQGSCKGGPLHMGKIHATHRCAAFSNGDFGQEAVVVCLSCAAYTCGKVYALAEACKPHLAANADRKRVLARVKAGAHPGAGSWPVSWCSWALRER